MSACSELRKRLGDLAALPAAEVPAVDREHLAGCMACARVLAGARLTRGLVAVAAEAPEPPAGFAERVVAVLPAPVARGRIQPDLWRAAWGLVPAFAAAAAALLILFQTSAAPIPGGLLSVEGLSAGERLVMEAHPPDPDLVLAAVLEGRGR